MQYSSDLELLFRKNKNKEDHTVPAWKESTFLGGLNPRGDATAIDVEYAVGISVPK